MASVVYALCAITALVCTIMLLQAYRSSSYRLLLWSSICFAGLTLNNTLLVVDKIVLPLVDLSTARTFIALLSMAILLYGLIWEAE
jgi:hypothetical protein